MKWFLLLFLFLIFTPILSVKASNIYISQSGAGAQTGVDVGNAYALSWANTSGNWGIGAGKINSGNQLHLVGTFSSQLIIQGDGSAGNPVLINLESGANF